MATAIADLKIGSTYRASLIWGAIPPALAGIIAPTLPPVAAAWLLAVAIFVMFKVWTLQNFARSSNIPKRQALAYLFAWPGMDPSPFVAAHDRVEKPARRDWIWALAETMFGILMVWFIARQFVNEAPLLAGWLGLVGLAFLLHFGLFHLLGLAWRQVGVPVEPLMNNPMAASSVSDFWSHRWNLAFRDLAQVFFFRPFISHVGVGGAMMIVFAMSGLIHDVVISLPAGGGHGWPTLYFILQGTAILLEKSRIGRRLGLGRGIRGRLFGWLVVVPGAYWLFHPPFIREVVLPTLSVIGGM